MTDDAPAPRSREPMSPRGVALLGAVSALLGALIGAGAGVVTTLVQVNHALSAEDRQTSAQVYTDYLDSAVRLRDAVTGLFALQTGVPQHEAQEQLALVFEQLSKIRDAETALDVAANQLYVYASQEAWMAHLEFKTSVALMNLSNSMSDSDVAGAETTYQVAIDELERKMLKVMCEELDPVPRADC